MIGESCESRVHNKLASLVGLSDKEKLETIIEIISLQDEEMEELRKKLAEVS